MHRCRHRRQRAAADGRGAEPARRPPACHRPLSGGRRSARGADRRRRRATSRPRLRASRRGAPARGPVRVDDARDARPDHDPRLRKGERDPVPLHGACRLPSAPAWGSRTCDTASRSCSGPRPRAVTRSSQRGGIGNSSPAESSLAALFQDFIAETDARCTALPLVLTGSRTATVPEGVSGVRLLYGFFPQRAMSRWTHAVDHAPDERIAIDDIEFASRLLQRAGAGRPALTGNGSARNCSKLRVACHPAYEINIARPLARGVRCLSRCADLPGVKE